MDLLMVMSRISFQFKSFCFWNMMWTVIITLFMWCVASKYPKENTNFGNRAPTIIYLCFYPFLLSYKFLYFNYFIFNCYDKCSCFIWLKSKSILQFTYKGHYQDSEEDPQSIAENVHEDNRDQSYTKIALTLPPLALLTAQNLKTWKFSPIFSDYVNH